MAELDELKTQVLRANRLLPETGLVIGTHGNASGWSAAREMMVIKPSGVPYPELVADDLVVIDGTGRVVAGRRKPSVDWPHHLFLYRRVPGLGGVVHTHSVTATAFAAAGAPIPCLSTGQADVFGGPVPVTPYVDNRGDAIGEAIVRFRRPGCPAVLLGSHGVFSFAATPLKALEAARLTEYFAQVHYRALMVGAALGRTLTAMPPAETRKWFDRYHGGGYGQDEADKAGG